MDNLYIINMMCILMLNFIVIFLAFIFRFNVDAFTDDQDTLQAIAL